MSNATHTPGPWEYDPDGDFYNAPNGVAYVDLSAGAPVESPSRWAEISKGPTAKADARLIAAAPDLLEALKLAQEVIDDELENRPARHSLGRLHAQCCAAIAKAEGKVK